MPIMNEALGLNLLVDVEKELHRIKFSCPVEYQGNNMTSIFIIRIIVIKTSF